MAASVMSLKGNTEAHKTTLTTAKFFIEVPVSSQEIELSCMRVLGVYNLPISVICLGLWTIATEW